MEIELRVILLIVGVIILFVVGIDLFRRKHALQSTTKTAALQREELLEQPFFDPVVDLEPIPAPKYTRNHEPIILEDEPIEQFVAPKSTENLKPIPNNIISITLRSRGRYGFKGTVLLEAMRSANLHFGKNNIFYRHIDDAGTGEILFSLVKAVEPGYFYMETLADEHVPGITLILLPEQIDNPHLAFDKLVRTAKQLAFTLNAELLDHERKALTLETIERYNKQAKQR